MKREACCALGLLLALAAPLAGAESRESPLRALAPVVLHSPFEAEIPSSVTAVLALGDGAPEMTASLRARKLNVTVTSWESGCLAVVPLGLDRCVPADSSGGQPVTRAFTFHDANVTFEEAGKDALILATNDEAHRDALTGPPGRFVVASGAAEGALSAAPDGHEFKVEVPGGGGVAYSIAAGTLSVAAGEARIEATGWMEGFLWDVVFRVTGNDEQGRPMDLTFTTGSDESEAAPGIDHRSYARYAVVEVEDAALAIESRTPVLVFGSGIVARAHEGVLLSEATGTIDEGGEKRRLTSEDVELPGDLTLVPLSATVERDSDGEARVWIDLRIHGAVETFKANEVRSPSRIPTGASGVAAAGLALGGLLGAIAYFWPSLRYSLTLLFIPMYTRIERDDVLEHGKREEIYELIRGAPGIHAHEISSRAEIGWGTAVYHLHLLENHGLVVSKRTGRYKRFFVTAGGFTHRKDAYGALRHETANRIASFVVKNPGTSQKQVCEALGLQPSLVTWHISRLEEAELVKKVKDGRLVRYFAGPAWNDLNLQVLPVASTPAPAQEPPATET